MIFHGDIEPDDDVIVTYESVQSDAGTQRRRGTVTAVRGSFKNPMTRVAIAPDDGGAQITVGYLGNVRVATTTPRQRSTQRQIGTNGRVYTLAEAPPAGTV